MQNKLFQDGALVKGWVKRRLFSGHKFLESIENLGVYFTAEEKALPQIDVIITKAYDAGLNSKLVSNLLEKSAKKQFSDNFIWRFLNKNWGLDLQIPLLLGHWTDKAIKRNTITTVGKQICAQQVGGTTTAPVTAIALGVGTPSTTALGSESTTNGSARGAATVTNQTTTLTGDTERWAKTFSLSGAFTFTEEGLFDNNTSGGNMLASQSFSAVDVSSGDAFAITHNVKFA